MKETIHRIFIVNWPRKLIALLSAIVIWFLVNQTVTVTKTFPHVAVRVINLPAHKTISGLLPGGLLSKKIPLTITGDKGTLEELSSPDLEIVINAEEREESFIAKIDKKNLVLPFKEESLKNGISAVSSDDLFIKISNFVTEEIPLIINVPQGEAPHGFQFLDIHPKNLTQRVSGPEEEIEALKKTGLEVTFDLDKISKEELDAIKTIPSSYKSDEVSFFVPTSWKKVNLPFADNGEEFFNDPRAQYLRIEFLKQETLPIDISIPILLFFPEKNLEAMNPQNYKLAPSNLIKEQHGAFFWNAPLFAYGISRQFLEIVKESLALCIIVEPNKNILDPTLKWTLLVINEKALEMAFINCFNDPAKYSDDVLKKRFNDYLNNMKLYSEKNIPLEINVYLFENQIMIRQ